MKQISVFQTDDGQMFADRAEANEHQLVIDIRGILNRANERSVTRKTPEQIIASQCDEVFERLKKFRASRGSIKAAAKKG